MASNANTRVSLAKVAEYVEALTRDPASRVFVPLSEIYRQAGMLEEAQAVLLKGIRQNPDFGPAYIALGRTLLAREMPLKAEKAFRKAVHLEPESLPALKGLLRLLWEKGDAGGTRRTAEAVYHINPGDSDAEKILQRLVERHEKEPASAAAGEEGAGPEKTEGEEPIKTATLADIYVRQGLFEKALNVYRQILNRDPQNQIIKRKALAVEKRLEEQRARPAQAPSPTESATAAEPEPESRDEAAIRALEGWLDSIRQRRAHVQ